MKKSRNVLIAAIVALVLIVIATMAASCRDAVLEREAPPEPEVEKVEAVPAGLTGLEPAGTNPGKSGLTTGEIMAIYPGYLDSLKVPVPSMNRFTTQEIMAIYPGYLESLKDYALDMNRFTTQEIMAIYPGYLESLKDYTLDMSRFTTDEIMAIYPGYLESLKDSVSSTSQPSTAEINIVDRTLEDVLKQLPFVPPIYFNP